MRSFKFLTNPKKLINENNNKKEYRGYNSNFKIKLKRIQL